MRRIVVAQSQLYVLASECPLFCHLFTMQCNLCWLHICEKAVCLCFSRYVYIRRWNMSNPKNCMCWLIFLITLKCSSNTKIDDIHLFRFLCNLFSGSFSTWLRKLHNKYCVARCIITFTCALTQRNLTLCCNKWMSLSACDIWNGRMRWD